MRSDTTTDERDARMGLACVYEAAVPAFLQLVAEHGPVAVWNQLRTSERDSPYVARAWRTSLAVVHRDTEKHRLRFVIPGDAEWPAQVDDLDRGEAVGSFAGAPIGLWVAGDAGLADATRRSVAIVGSRNSTEYGDTVSAEIAHGVAEKGVTVVSGGAFGIDAAAHRGALAAGGTTLAVMAGGLAQWYPQGNAVLLDRVRESGLVISEHEPTTPPSRARFLSRNRLIAALSQATVVVEAATRSGAGNTVHWALSLGRPVLAVPGLVTSRMSVRPHMLIRDGEATLVETAEHVLEAIAPIGEAPAPLPFEAGNALDGVSAQAQRVHDCLPGRGAVAVDDLCLAAGARPPQVLAALSELEEAGLAERTDDGRWQTRRGARRGGAT